MTHTARRLLRTAAPPIAALLLLTPSSSRAVDRSIVPGLFGYNALPTVPNADPQVEDRAQLEVSMAAQVSDFSGARDASATPYLRLVVAFLEFSALEADAVPVELWRVGPETRRRMGASEASGVARGDLRFGARFTLLREREILPAVGVRFITKTTTGKSFDNRRFIDAPGYVVDALFGKTLPIGLGPFDNLRVLAKVGFAAWQQGSGSQDDAVDLGATLQLRSMPGTYLELEWRGYWGYERYDRPSVLGLTLRHPAAGELDVVGTLNRGLSRDAPPWEIRLGMIVHFDLGTGAAERSGGPRDLAGHNRQEPATRCGDVAHVATASRWRGDGRHGRCTCDRRLPADGDDIADRGAPIPWANRAGCRLDLVVDATPE